MLLFVDNLTNVDFSFLEPSRGLLGQTWLAQVTLEGALDEQGMVCDFGTVKKVIRRWLDDELDHRLAIPMNSPQLDIHEHGDYVDITWRFGDESAWLRTRAPRCALALIDTDVLTPDSVANWCINQLSQEFPFVDKLSLSFIEEDIEGASYQYSHGLKKHLGNCQRIAHGHRSRIDIWLNGEKSPALEYEWAKQLRDIYIGTEEDMVALEPHLSGDFYGFRYRAQQGDFSITIPKRCCHLMTTDSTVELIATHIADRIKHLHPTDSVKVKAFEGIGKGAIVER
jgi:6-pyruvoyl-tetrahydropterin synthase